MVTEGEWKLRRRENYCRNGPWNQNWSKMDDSVCGWIGVSDGVKALFGGVCRLGEMI